METNNVSWKLGYRNTVELTKLMLAEIGQNLRVPLSPSASTTGLVSCCS